MTSREADQAALEAYQRAAESAATANDYATVLWIALVFGCIAVVFLLVDMRRCQAQRRRADELRTRRIVERYVANPTEWTYKGPTG